MKDCYDIQHDRAMVWEIFDTVGIVIIPWKTNIWDLEWYLLLF